MRWRFMRVRANCQAQVGAYCLLRPCNTSRGIERRHCQLPPVASQHAGEHLYGKL